MTDELLLAIDGGGSKTDVCIARMGTSKKPNVIGRARGGPSNLTAMGVDRVEEILTSVIGLAASKAGLSRPRFDRAIIALAGGGNTKLCEQLENRLAANTSGKVRVFSDAELILAIAEALAPEDHAAVAILVGTGSVAYARDPKSLDTVRVGGWGPLIGDDGSGFWIGRSAIRSVLMQHDEQRPRSDLANSIYESIGASSARDLVGKIYKKEQPSAALAGLAPFVFQAAADGDAIAQRILVEAAICIGVLIGQISDKLNTPPEKTVVACGGSLITQKTLLTERVDELVKANGTNELYFIEDPVSAAVQLAASPRFSV